MRRLSTSLVGGSSARTHSCFVYSGHSSVVHQRNNVDWIPPEPDCVKVNTDDAVDVNGGISAIGLVARDQDGLVLARSRKGLCISYVRREANKAAHWCAQEGLKSASDVILFDVFPDSLIVQSDEEGEGGYILERSWLWSNSKSGTGSMQGVNEAGDRRRRTGPNLGRSARSHTIWMMLTVRYTTGRYRKDSPESRRFFHLAGRTSSLFAAIPQAHAARAAKRAVAVVSPSFPARAPPLPQHCSGCTPESNPLVSSRPTPPRQSPSCRLKRRVGSDSERDLPLSTSPSGDGGGDLAWPNHTDTPVHGARTLLIWTAEMVSCVHAPDTSFPTLNLVKNNNNNNNNENHTTGGIGKVCRMLTDFLRSCLPTNISTGDGISLKLRASFDIILHLTRG
ncbi:uncharacterized protein [Triticum aestivum]|uniref:uncharacterized protein n=1 Tax=Triticum aestivum TaxID=4565 RepID=UPI001D0132E0|nr:uncharacterized protein LOC123068037 [Triticum aestivum]